MHPETGPTMLQGAAQQGKVEQCCPAESLIPARDVLHRAESTKHGHAQHEHEHHFKQTDTPRSNGKKGDNPPADDTHPRHSQHSTPIISSQ
jgi:hypothetical protein